jgi:hypothetical protein
MNRAGSFLLGMAVGATALMLAMNYTAVQARDGFHFVRKISPKLELPFVDIRQFRLEQWQKKQSLALAILRAKKGYLLTDPALISFKQSSQQMLDQYSRPMNQANAASTSALPTLVSEPPAAVIDRVQPFNPLAFHQN